MALGANMMMDVAIRYLTRMQIQMFGYKLGEQEAVEMEQKVDEKTDTTLMEKRRWTNDFWKNTRTGLRRDTKNACCCQIRKWGRPKRKEI
jgi:hypothetical protein